MNIKKEALLLHKKLRGKIEVRSKILTKNKKNLSLIYTPGVGVVSQTIAKNKKEAYKYTSKQNSVAIVTDGSAVLGLGNLGPEAALPVMEGKAVIFKEFANLDAWPICLKTQNTEEIINIVKAIAPSFGAINLEDISTPRCFAIEEQLKKELDIPVMHDDQHGTAIVVLAGLINALKVVKKNPRKIKVMIAGAGAAGTAIFKMLLRYGITNICICDVKGTIHKERKDITEFAYEISKTNNKSCLRGACHVNLAGADVFIGVSAPNILNSNDIKKMAKKPIVFALANPEPEIKPELAKKAGVLIVATGRSDYPNQINNALAYPGVFRGALNAKAKKITDKMKMAAALTLAHYIKNPTPKKIIPDVLDKKIHQKVALAVKKAAT